MAYVFIHLLPEPAEGQGFVFLEVHVYRVTLLGLATFYGLGRLATSSRRRKRGSGKGDSTGAGVF